MLKHTIPSLMFSGRAPRQHEAAGGHPAHQQEQKHSFQSLTSRGGNVGAPDPTARPGEGRGVGQDRALPAREQEASCPA